MSGLVVAHYIFGGIVEVLADRTVGVIAGFGFGAHRVWENVIIGESYYESCSRS